jgi:hypothetical protein
MYSKLLRNVRRGPPGGMEPPGITWVAVVAQGVDFINKAIMNCCRRIKWIGGGGDLPVSDDCRIAIECVVCVEAGVDSTVWIRDLDVDVLPVV